MFIDIHAGNRRSLVFQPLVSFGTRRIAAGVSEAKDITEGSYEISPFLIWFPNSKRQRHPSRKFVKNITIKKAEKYG